ncbi:hypothetical protein CRYUN_Cryun33cG0075600 [Craigia yunnanensis]
MHHGGKDASLDCSHYWVWGLPFFLLYSTKSHQFLHERTNQSILRILLCYMLSPMRRGVSKFIACFGNFHYISME